MPARSYWKPSKASQLLLPYGLFSIVAFVPLAVSYHLKWLPSLTQGILGLSLPVGTYLAYQLGPVRRFRRRLSGDDFCMFCWYSLKGHGKEGVCPECGKDIAVSLSILEWYRNGKWYRFIFL